MFKILFKTLSLLLTLALTTGLAITAHAQTANDTEKRSWLYYWQQAVNAHKKQDHAAFLTNAEAVSEAGPKNHPVILLLLARAYSLAGKKAEAVRTLEQIAGLGLSVDASANADLKSLIGWPEFERVVGKLNANKAPAIRGTTAFTISEKDLIPEGIAYDPVGKRFYVGSMYKSKIVSIDLKGGVRDFTTEGQDGLTGVVGMRVDAPRRILWVNTVVLPELRGFKKENDGISAIHKYDLKTGRFIKRYVLDNKPAPHLLNDIAVRANGDLFITDSAAAEIHTLRASEDRLEPFLKLDQYLYPNGITLSDDEKLLFVADFAGINVVNIDARTRTRLAYPETATVSGIDGLYFYRDSLVAVQNGHDPARVVRFYLSPSRDSVTRAEVIESNHPAYNIPTTGAIADGSFYYIANSQMRSFDAQGAIFSLDKLKPVVILKVPLG
ncbi:MAG TPA: SMP-30/gluconolactonase/LRE family protein [Blastocatellia bacterium]|nr:SMP-30/gluconolactonase/LRE family protein [Blastocatellia bacterium]